MCIRDRIDGYQTNFYIQMENAVRIYPSTMRYTTATQFTNINGMRKRNRIECNNLTNLSFTVSSPKVCDPPAHPMGFKKRSSFRIAKAFVKRSTASVKEINPNAIR
eukprot:TRINITY_DN11481_c0_g1_i1.p1 TRINITY_DN11481_c0_g1~~TRINITY_DN11481_c0_g1_i1.p1  ORF type:complete len:106 (-),score=4.72 TRINITY_DN11481_c0_g1_i1:29-346(-)